MQAHLKVGEAAGWWEREAARYLANPPFEEWEKQRLLRRRANDIDSFVQALSLERLRDEERKTDETASVSLSTPSFAAL